MNTLVVPPESSSVIGGESTAMTRATTEAAGGGVQDHLAKDQVDIGNKYAQDTLDDSGTKRHCHSFDFKKCSIYSSFVQGLNVVLHNRHVLLKSVGALNQGVVLLDTLREQINLDLHHRPVTELEHSTP